MHSKPLFDPFKLYFKKRYGTYNHSFDYYPFVDSSCHPALFKMADKLLKKSEKSKYKKKAGTIPAFFSS